VTAQQPLDVGRTAAGQKLLHMETLLMLTVAENGKQCPAGQSLVQSSCGCCGQEEFFAKDNFNSETSSLHWNSKLRNVWGKTVKKQ